MINQFVTSGTKRLAASIAMLTAFVSMGAGAVIPSFLYRGPVSAKWVRTRYVAEANEI